MRRIRFAALVFLSALPALAATPAQTPYPTRAIHIIVPFPAGGPSDVLARWETVLREAGIRYD